jgi:hypothetical protein
MNGGDATGIPMGPVGPVIMLLSLPQPAATKAVAPTNVNVMLFMISATPSRPEPSAPGIE